MQIYTGNPSGSQHKIGKLQEYGLGVMLSVGPSSACKSIVKANGYCAQQIPMAVDNGAYMAWRKGYPFNAQLFRDLLTKAYLAGVEPDFIVCPDLIGQGRKSLSFSMKWAKGELAGTPHLALAVQDELTPGDLTAHERRGFSHIFVGGTTAGEGLPGRDWKWETAESWVDFAHNHNMRCHMGRCGQYADLLRAQKLGFDSVDSSSFVRNESWEHLEAFRNGPKQEEIFA